MVSRTQEMELFFNTRTEKRVKLAVAFKLRHQYSEPFAYEEVMAENISRRGLCITTKEKLPEQTRVYLEGPGRRFKALAVVVHSTPWQAGLQIVATMGHWLIG